MADFTLSTYEKLLTALNEGGYRFYTFGQWCKERPNGKIVILRHDIDKMPLNALDFAKLENKLGLSATYFFLIKKSVFDAEIICSISDLGHEIGYHYRDYVDAKGDKIKAIKSFENNLSKIRAIVNIDTIAMDGCPWSKYDNRDIWKKYDYQVYDIVGEPYFDFLGNEVISLYFTDTGRRWNNDKFNVRDKQWNIENCVKPDIHSTFDFIQWIKKSDNKLPIMITTHPQRWTNNYFKWTVDLGTQNIKNLIKYCFIKIR